MGSGDTIQNMSKGVGLCDASFRYRLYRGFHLNSPSEHS